ncbi:MAG TPA: hypothetical protein VKE74_00390 [Gemmataceae bacterium]|nr:hypothetical protein [Gemmataceae bacterium]
MRGSNSGIREHREPELPEEAILRSIQVQLIEGVFTDAQTREMIRALTGGMVSVEGKTCAR